MTYVPLRACGLRAGWMLDGQPYCRIHLLARLENASQRSRTR